MSDRFESAANVPVSRMKMTTRPTVDYRTFVDGFAARCARYTGATFTGVALIVGTLVLVTSPDATVVFFALGLGLVAVGGAGLLTSWHAHAQYHQWYRVETAETFEPRQEPAPRPFVPTQNGAIMIGRYRADVIAALLRTADERGKLTRDGAKGRVPRPLYNGWGETTDEMRRLGYIDADNRLTTAGYAMLVGPPYPQPAAAFRPSITRAGDGRADAGDAFEVTE